MKTTLSIFALSFVFIFSGFAQTEKGKIMAGGSFGINFGNSFAENGGAKGPKTNHSYIDFEPKAGYFVRDGLAVGLEVDLSKDTYKYQDSKENYHSVTFGPFARYYSSTGFFGEFGFGLGGGKYKQEDIGEEDPYEYKYGIFEWSLGAGYAIFLNEHVSIEPMITYNRYNETGAERSDYKFKEGKLKIEVGINIFLPNTLFE